jgi:ferredoxin-NADP reductase
MNNSWGGFQKIFNKEKIAYLVTIRNFRSACRIPGFALPWTGMPVNSNIPRLCVVLDHFHVGAHAKILRIERLYDFNPGQVIGLATKSTNDPRWYSVCNSPSEPYIEILYTLVPDGLLSPVLFGLNKGDRLWLWPPQGNFGMAVATSPRVWWIANGTGVAPFAAMFAAGQRIGRGLIHGSRTQEDAYFADAFRSDPELMYVPCLSRPEAPWYSGMFTGRLLNWLLQMGPEYWREGDRFLLCGSAGMVVESREILIHQGVGHEAIASEIYF